MVTKWNPTVKLTYTDPKGHRRFVVTRRGAAMNLALKCREGGCTEIKIDGKPV